MRSEVSKSELLCQIVRLRWLRLGCLVVCLLGVLNGCGAEPPDSTSQRDGASKSTASATPEQADPKGPVSSDVVVDDATIDEVCESLTAEEVSSAFETEMAISPLEAIEGTPDSLEGCLWVEKASSGAGVAFGITLDFGRSFDWPGDASGMELAAGSEPAERVSGLGDMALFLENRAGGYPILYVLNNGSIDRIECGSCDPAMAKKVLPTLARKSYERLD